MEARSPLDELLERMHTLKKKIHDANQAFQNDNSDKTHAFKEKFLERYLQLKKDIEQIEKTVAKNLKDGIPPSQLIPPFNMSIGQKEREAEKLFKEMQREFTPASNASYFLNDPVLMQGYRQANKEESERAQKEWQQNLELERAKVVKGDLDELKLRFFTLDHLIKKLDADPLFRDNSILKLAKNPSDHTHFLATGVDDLNSIQGLMQAAEENVLKYQGSISWMLSVVTTLEKHLAAEERRVLDIYHKSQDVYESRRIEFEASSSKDKKKEGVMNLPEMESESEEVKEKKTRELARKVLDKDLSMGSPSKELAQQLDNLNKGQGAKFEDANFKKIEAVIMQIEALERYLDETQKKMKLPEREDDPLIYFAKWTLDKVKKSLRDEKGRIDSSNPHVVRNLEFYKDIVSQVSMHVKSAEKEKDRNTSVRNLEAKLFGLFKENERSDNLEDLIKNLKVESHALPKQKPPQQVKPAPAKLSKKLSPEERDQQVKKQLHQKHLEELERKLREKKSLQQDKQRLGEIQAQFDEGTKELKKGELKAWVDWNNDFIQREIAFETRFKSGKADPNQLKQLLAEKAALEDERHQLEYVKQHLKRKWGIQNAPEHPELPPLSAQFIEAAHQQEEKKNREEEWKHREAERDLELKREELKHQEELLSLREKAQKDKDDQTKFQQKQLEAEQKKIEEEKKKLSQAEKKQDKKLQRKEEELKDLSGKTGKLKEFEEELKAKESKLAKERQEMDRKKQDLDQQKKKLDEDHQKEIERRRVEAEKEQERKLAEEQKRDQEMRERFQAEYDRLIQEQEEKRKFEEQRQVQESKRADRPDSNKMEEGIGQSQDDIFGANDKSRLSSTASNQSVDSEAEKKKKGKLSRNPSFENFGEENIFQQKPNQALADTQDLSQKKDSDQLISSDDDRDNRPRDNQSANDGRDQQPIPPVQQKGSPEPTKPIIPKKSRKIEEFDTSDDEMNKPDKVNASGKKKLEKSKFETNGESSSDSSEAESEVEDKFKSNAEADLIHSEDEDEDEEASVDEERDFGPVNSARNITIARFVDHTYNRFIKMANISAALVAQNATVQDDSPIDRIANLKRGLKGCEDIANRLEIYIRFLESNQNVPPNNILLDTERFRRIQEARSMITGLRFIIENYNADRRIGFYGAEAQIITPNPGESLSAAIERTRSVKISAADLATMYVNNTDGFGKTQTFDGKTSARRILDSIVPSGEPRMNIGGVSLFGKNKKPDHMLFETIQRTTQNGANETFSSIIHYDKSNMKFMTNEDYAVLAAKIVNNHMQANPNASSGISLKGNCPLKLKKYIKMYCEEKGIQCARFRDEKGQFYKPTAAEKATFKGLIDANKSEIYGKAMKLAVTKEDKIIKLMKETGVGKSDRKFAKRINKTLPPPRI